MPAVTIGLKEGRGPREAGRGPRFAPGRALLLSLAFLLAGSAAWAADADMQVSAYTWTPDPVVHSGTVTFTVTVQNNGPASSTGSTLTVNLPANAAYAGNVSGCTPSMGNTVLTCPIAALNMAQTATVIYTATGASPDARGTSATIADNTAGNTDPNSSNNTLNKLVTSIAGADLTVTNTGPASANAGDIISFTLTANNAGPDPASLFRVTDNLPAAIDFQYQSASGTSWSCSQAGTTVTCDYTGAALASGASAPAITITGRIITTAGTITNGSSIASTDGSTGDPLQGNNTAPNVTVTVFPATSLRANKTMTSSTTGSTSVYLSGETVTLALSATNNGPQNATGVAVTDTVPVAFTIGTLPGGCVAAGQTITCTIGNLNSGVTSSSFSIPLTAPVVGSSTAGSNTATVSRTTPAAGTNQSATVNYTITPPFAHLTLAKTKTPSPVYAGSNITNTITVTNSASSTSAATGTVTVVDTLTDYPNEIFISAAAPWSCVDAAGTVTCTYTIPASLAVGASLPNLVITTQVDGAFTGGSLSNTACTGLGYSGHTPADNAASCMTRSVYGTQLQADLEIAKSVDDTVIDTTETTLTYTLTVTNNGPNQATTVTMSDPVPVYYGGPIGITTGTVTVSGGLGAGESCSGIAATVTCTLKDLANGASRVITIALNRPFTSGANFTNTAVVSSSDTVETNNANNSAQATVTTIAAVTDVAVTGGAVSLDPVKAGVQEQTTFSFKNLGPNPATGVVVEIPIDTTKVTLVPGSVQLTGTGGSCTTGAAMTDPAWAPGTPPGIRCTGFSMAGDESRQVIFRVIPVYPYPGPTYTAEARILTASYETDATNNYGSVTANVINPQLDLVVTKQEALGYDPDGGGPLTNQLYDPVAFGDQIKYLVTIRNNGPSQATQVTLTDILTPPVGGYTGTFASGVFDAGNSSYTPATAITCADAAGTVTCYLGTSAGVSLLPPNSYVTIVMTYDTGGTVPSGSLTYSNAVSVTSLEVAAGYDSIPANNSAVETTTILPRADLFVQKATSASPVEINQPFSYTITVGNLGSSIASGIRVTDPLPAGFVMNGAVTVARGAGVSLITSSCTAPAAGSNGTISCDLGPIPADATGVDATKQVVITVPVKAGYPYSGALLTDIANTATIAPLPNTSLDLNYANNTSTANVQVRSSSIAGTVYSDNNKNDVIDAGEGVNGFTLTLSGTDAYGNALSGIAVTTAGGGLFTFDRLPPGTYQIVETQLAGYYDRFETAGTAGGTTPPNTCDGIANCGPAAALNTISAITLPANTAATGYVFQEYRRGQINGYVYHDANNDGDRAGAATGIAAQNIVLSGTAYNGVSVCTVIAPTSCTQNTNASGQYSFGTIPPSDGTGYTITQNAQPVGYLDGKEQGGAGVGNVVPGSGGRTLPESITGIALNPNQTLTERNFGELLPAAISGYVFIDLDSDAVRDAGETSGVTSVTVTLTGTDDLGNAVSTSTTSAANGLYTFSGLRPGTYTVTETPPGGLTHTGAQAGSKGGSGQPAGTALPGAGVVSITNIPIVSNDAATGYNFGETGQGLAGTVYLDSNSNGALDVGEPGIPGVTVTLSGNTSIGTNVCVAISPNPCSVTTDASGGYLFSGLPASDVSGYTLTEQSQAAAPLNNYADGSESVGTQGGSAAVNDRFTGIVLGVAQFGSGYNFAEFGGRVAGTVYLDVNNSGGLDAGDTGIPGVTVTLSGTTASGANVCTLIPSCSAVTDASGDFAFASLPASNGAGYTLTETQPPDYASAVNTVGSAGGTPGVNAFTGIVIGTGVSATGYRFGEKTGALSGFVYLDVDNDGTKDGGETPIAGVTITLSGTTASGLDVCSTIPSCFATTAADGSYGFSGLRNANGAGYIVTETQPGGYLDGRVATGTINGVPCAACVSTTANRISAIPFNAAQTFTAFDFGELLSSQLSGRVYADANNNASYDAGEELAGVLVTLTGTDDQGTVVNQSSATAADGTYSFTGLRPGNPAGYTLTETQPAGIGDYPLATGTQAGTISGSTVGTAALNRISAIVLPQNAAGVNYNFRDNASGFSGFVYLDANNDGAFGGGETGIDGVTITLTGTDAGGNPVNRTTATASGGSYGFIGLTSGTYTLTETHPVIYRDGQETAGTAGGAVDNGSFTFAPAQNRISTIALPGGTAATGYLFGEQAGLPAQVSGTAWQNSIAHDQIRQPGEPGIAGWIVEAVQGGVVRGSATTAADGTYVITGLPAATGYEIRFRHPGNGAVYGDPVSQDPAYTDSVIDYSSHTIANLTLRTGANVINQNLPLDPSGVVYNSVTRAPISGATVAISGPPGFVPASHLSGGAGNQSQVTDATGFYQFLLLPGAPAGAYAISVTPPPGYVPAASSLIPPTAGPFDPGPGPGFVAIQAQATAPTGPEPTTYYLSFTLNGGSAGVVNNHVPVDPVLGGAIRLIKTSALVNVARGDLVPYTIEATNTLAATLSNIDLVDQMPPGFKYRAGSATLNGVIVAPTINGRTLRWPNLTFAANETKTIRLLLVVGSGVGEGTYTNQAWALNNLVDTLVSNIGEATVRIVPDPTFDCTDIIGKVFDDRNANGYQDQGERGIANVRIATARGWLVTTDAEGRFHVACAAIPQADRGSNFIMKLDERTLPSGFRMTTENPRVVRATRGKMVKLNFGAVIHRVVRVEVSDAAFEGDGVGLKPEWQKRFDSLPGQLREKPSVVRFAYRVEGGDGTRAKARLDHLGEALQKRWKALSCCYPLSIEQEFVEVSR